MNGKRYFNEIKKEICPHQLFSKLHNYFPTNSPRTAFQYTSANAAPVFEIRPLKNGVLFLKPFPHCRLASPLHHRWSAGPSRVPLVLGTGGNHLEPDLGHTVDVAALKIPGVELHLLLLHLCEVWRRTHLAQTFRNPRTPIMCLTLSLEIPNATAISFCLMRRFPRISSSTRSWLSWSLAVTGLPLRVLSLKSACPTSPSLNRVTQRLTILTSAHWSRLAFVCEFQLEGLFPRLRI